MSKRIGILVVVCAVALAVGIAAKRVFAVHVESPEKVVLIVLDTVRSDFLSPYGGPAYLSPALEQFSKSSVLFERAISPAPWTFPAVASIFTSTYPNDHKLTDYRYHPKIFANSKPYLIPQLSPGIPTIGELMKQAGFRGYSSSENSWILPVTGLRRGFDVEDDQNLSGPSSLSVGAKWFQESRGKTFIHLHLFAAHGPYGCTEDEVNAIRPYFQSADRPITDAEIAAQNGPNFMAKLPKWVPPELWRMLSYWKSCYASGVRRADKDVGVFLEKLKQDPSWDRTMVIIVADHGEEFLEHGGWEHGAKFNYHTIDVPLLIRFPRDQFGGTRIHEAVSSVDILPTILDVVGRSDLIPHFARGESLIPLVTAPNAERPRRFLFSSSSRRIWHAVGVVSGKYRLIADFPKPGKYEFFDDETDPLEQHPNLLHPAVADLFEAVAKYHAEPSIVPATPEEKEMDQPAVDKLKSLGYIR